MNRRQYVVTLADRDKPFRDGIRSAVDQALVTRPELGNSHVMIVSPNWRPRSGARKPPSTLVAGPTSEGVRILMNIVADVTGGSVSGELLPT
jgi:hypothetical protein